MAPGKGGKFYKVRFSPKVPCSQQVVNRWMDQSIVTLIQRWVAGLVGTVRH